MKRSNSKRVPGVLPSFLDEAARHPAAIDTSEVAAAADAAADADTGDRAAADDADVLAEGAATQLADEGGASEDAAASDFEQELADALGESQADAQRPSASGDAGAPGPAEVTAPAAATRGSGTLVMMLGAAALAAPVVEAVATRGGSWPLPTTPLLALGVLLFLVGAMQRHVAMLQQRADDVERRRRAESDALQQQLRQLADDSHRDKAPAQGEELQHVMMSLQRQDEKINNLTKAIKMYGKPLMEITGQGTEFAGSLATVKTLVEGSMESARQGIARLETQLRTANSTKELGELGAAMQKLAQRVEALPTKTAAPVSLEPLQQQLGRLEVNLAAMAQRLEDSEVRKSLLRLEESTQKNRDTVQELLRGDGLRKATEQLQQRVDTVAKGLGDGLTKLRDSNLGALEQTVREIQREVAGVATAVSQIQAGIKAAPRPSAPATAAAPQASATAPVASTGSAAPAVPSAAATATAPTAEPAAAYQTGTRTSGSKNVLGAIAKLKQMKG